MDFGRVPVSELNGIDFKLPKEPYVNNTVFPSVSAKHPKIYVGLSKWARKEYLGVLYPRLTKDAQFISEYSKHFNSVELNATHYKLYDKNFYKTWVNKTDGRPMLFCPKVYQGISHFGTLDDKQFLTDTFFEGLKGFGDQLGPVFLQVSDKFGPTRKTELLNYITKLPSTAQLFLELRHQDWFADVDDFNEIVEKLKDLKIGLIITDTAGRRDVCHMHLTVSKSMIRFIAHGNHPSDYTRVDDWVSRIQYWVESGLQEVYFFLHCHDEGRHSLALINYAIKRLNEKCNAGLKELRLIYD